MSKNNPWNTTIDVVFDESVVHNVHEYYDKMHSLHRKCKEYRDNAIKDIKLDDHSIEYLKQKYYTEEYRIKLMARGLGVTYSVCRKILEGYLGFNIRKGRNVVTNRVRQFRSDRVIGDKNPWHIINPHQPDNSRSLQGYYITKNGKKVWLRSSWEYIYAKWLDDHDIKYEVEERSFLLSNGHNYKPDFFIYDDNNVLLYIVEIKGFNNNRAKLKKELFEKEYPEYDYIFIDDITDYCDNYKEAIKEWRKIRLK